MSNNNKMKKKVATRVHINVFSGITKAAISNPFSEEIQENYRSIIPVRWREVRGRAN